MLYWITGLAGSGKSSFARLLAADLRKSGKPVVYLDGDDLRSAISEDLGYTAEDRLKSAFRNARLCRLLESQGLSVICSTISMFDSVRLWNRQNIPAYTEVYIKVPLEILNQRDQKALYSGGNSGGQSKNVVGVDLAYEEPKNPDFVVEQDASSTVESSYASLSAELLKRA